MTYKIKKWHNPKLEMLLHVAQCTDVEHDCIILKKTGERKWKGL